MSVMVSGLMISREDVVRLSHNIARAIPADFLKNKETALKIAINGSFGCGKKLISDAMIEGLTGIDPNPREFVNGWTPETKGTYREYLKSRHERGYSFAGSQGRDEIIGVQSLDDTGLELMFLDLNFDTGLFDFCKGWGEISTARTIALFELERSRGGLTFIQNTDNMHIDGCHDRFEPDVDIWLESTATNFNNQPLRCSSLKGHLAEAFGEAARDNNWGRYCEVKLNNTDPALRPILDAAKYSLRQMVV